MENSELMNDKKKKTAELIWESWVVDSTTEEEVEYIQEDNDEDF